MPRQGLGIAVFGWRLCISISSQYFILTRISPNSIRKAINISRPPKLLTALVQGQGRTCGKELVHSLSPRNGRITQYPTDPNVCFFPETTATGTSALSILSIKPFEFLIHRPVHFRIRIVLGFGFDDSIEDFHHTADLMEVFSAAIGEELTIGTN